MVICRPLQLLLYWADGDSTARQATVTLVQSSHQESSNQVRSEATDSRCLSLHWRLSVEAGGAGLWVSTARVVKESSRPKLAKAQHILLDSAGAGAPMQSSDSSEKTAKASALEAELVAMRSEIKVRPFTIMHDPAFIVLICTQLLLICAMKSLDHKLSTATSGGSRISEVGARLSAAVASNSVHVANKGTIHTGTMAARLDGSGIAAPPSLAAGNGDLTKAAGRNAVVPPASTTQQLSSEASADHTVDDDMVISSEARETQIAPSTGLLSAPLRIISSPHRRGG
jgi:hypothetical protein